MANVLLIENDANFLETIQRALIDLGHTVTGVENGSQALNVVFSKAFDVAIIDIRLDDDLNENDISGILLSVTFGRFDKQIPVIFLTEYPRPSHLAHIIKYYTDVEYRGKLEPDLEIRLDEAITRLTQRRSVNVLGKEALLVVSLSDQQRIWVRGHGEHICSCQSDDPLKVDQTMWSRYTSVVGETDQEFWLQVKKNIGGPLFHAVFEEHLNIYGAYREARTSVDTLFLLFDGKTEMLQVPLEFMVNDAGQFIVLEHPVARFSRDCKPRRPPLSRQRMARMFLQSEKPLRVLLIASNPWGDLPGVEKEIEALANLLNNIQNHAGVGIDVTRVSSDEASIERVRRELAGNYDIIHYAGHGLFDPDSTDNSCLFFRDDEGGAGTVAEMKAPEVKQLLGKSKAHFVYLSCCLGTATGNDDNRLNDNFIGLADAVIQAGVPSVLGYRWPVSDDGAIKMAEFFYEALVDRGGPELALWRARNELFALNASDRTWLSPILIHQE